MPKGTKVFSAVFALPRTAYKCPGEQKGGKRGNFIKNTHKNILKPQAPNESTHLACVKLILSEVVISLFSVKACKHCRTLLCSCPTAAGCTTPPCAWRTELFPQPDLTFIFH